MSTSEARQYAARNRQGSDWFGHADNPVSQSAHPTSPAVTTPPAAVTAQTPPAAVTPPAASPPAVQLMNDAGSAGDTVTSPGIGRTKPIKPVSDSNQWYKYEQSGASGGDKAAASADNGDTYHQRGTASSWFSHESASSSDAAAHHRGNSKELGVNAARMRGESEQWFSHESKASSPVHNARGQANRPGNSSEMHDVFHHAPAANK